MHASVNSNAGFFPYFNQYKIVSDLHRKGEMICGKADTYFDCLLPTFPENEADRTWQADFFPAIYP